MEQKLMGWCGCKIPAPVGGVCYSCGREMTPTDRAQMYRALAAALRTRSAEESAAGKLCRAEGTMMEAGRLDYAAEAIEQALQK